METQRTVHTPQGDLTYTLSRKYIKNYNLRVRQGRVMLSVPMPVRERQADEFICARMSWIMAALARQTARPGQTLTPPPREQCLQILAAAVERVLPLVSQFGVTRPLLKMRAMRSQWGNCHYRQGYITLNTALAACPEELQDYVALHELVHFLHHDHGPGFYGRMDALMPDWKRRRLALREYSLT
ncbi:MAG: M48 family metallopeptidase [Oscillospiraceae bacterium]|nr:M48 family metallopeptidase [Oscillospiraceae bacterium]